MSTAISFTCPAPRGKAYSPFWVGLWAVCLAAAVLLALDWFTLPAPAENRAQTTASTSPTQAPPTSRVVAQAAVAEPDCTVVSPFAARELRCNHESQSVLDAHALDDLLEADTQAQARELHVQSDMAIDVLRVRPGASLAAYKNAVQCDAGALPDGMTKKDCADLRKVMPFVLMDLEFNAVNHRDRQAAIVMAEHHAAMLERVAPSVRVYHLKQVENYLGIVGGAFPDDVRALQRRIEEVQLENVTRTG